MIKSVHRLINNAIETGDTVYVLENRPFRFAKTISDLLEVVGVDVIAINRIENIGGINLDDKILVVYDRDIINSDVLEYTKCFKGLKIKIITEDIYGVTEDEVREAFGINKEKELEKIFDKY